MHISMDKRIRVPFYGSISLFIETLTGTYFKIHVLPSETILSIKAKIQRLEGIPISQQHLIWEGHELDDKMCLHEYRIPRDASIKLVTTLRGGPINTRKITTNDSSDYFDLSEDEFFDELPFTPGSNEPDSQVTLLVYRNGDQINFFRVMDCGGKMPPVPHHLRRQNSDSKPPSGVTKPRVTMSRIKENQITAAKMKKLQNQIKLLRLKENFNAANSDATLTEKPSFTNDDLTTELSDRASGSSKSRHKLDPLRNDQSSDKSRRPAGRVSASEKKGSSQDFSPKISFNRHEMYLRSYGLLPRNMDSVDAGDNDQDLSQKRSSIFPLDTMDTAHGTMGFETSDDVPTTSSAVSRMTVREITSSRGSKTLNKKEHLSVGGGEISALQESHTKLPLISTHSALTSTFANVNGIMSRSASRNAKTIGIESPIKGYDAVGLHTKFGEKSNLKFNHSRKLRPLPLDADDRMQLSRNEGVQNTSHGEAMMPYPPNQSTAMLPPVRPFVIKKKRCFLCGKKTGLASSYLCRCGENFCASHRYAEAHACTFDYKANGRQVLKEANPVISSRKLPKI